jgi:hypothetical protein
MVEVNDSVTSPDRALKVTLTAFDPKGGEGRVKIEELRAERGRFHATVGKRQRKHMVDGLNPQPV